MSEKKDTRPEPERIKEAKEHIDRESMRNKLANSPEQKRANTPFKDDPRRSNPR